jgi:hypothetical protein
MNVQCEKITQENNVFSCSFCNKFYSSKSTLTRHLKDNCKIKKNNDNEKESIFKLLLEKDKENKEKINQLEKQNKLLMQKIDKLLIVKDKKNKSSNIINNNISNSNNTISNSNNTQNNIILVNHGNEDLSIIDKKIFLDRVVKKNISGVKIPDG